MLLIGNWSDPISPDEAGGEQVLRDFIERKGCKCAFCGTQTRLTPQTPLGYFNVCLSDRSLPNEPVNWVPLCAICTDFNDLGKLRGKGSFIEAPWISQGKLINLLRLSYAVAVRPEGDWGTVADSSKSFLNAIDSIPESWDALNWKGDVETLEVIFARMIHPLKREAYANWLRFRFDLEPYEDAIRYWAVALEQVAIEANLGS